MILKLLSDFIFSWFGQIKSQIKSQIFKIISNQFKLLKLTIYHLFQIIDIV